MKRLFVDMDGTAAEFKAVDTLETLYEPGYFLSLKPQQNVVDAVKLITEQRPDVDVYIMSSVLTDSKYALQEKNQWLDRYLPEIPESKRIFPPCGDDKKEHIPDGIRTTDMLLDDYTTNLLLWDPPGKGLKVLNGINHTRGTWKGDSVSYEHKPQELADKILTAIDGGTVQDRRPQDISDYDR